jgi:hypothetical protein
MSTQADDACNPVESDQLGKSGIGKRARPPAPESSTSLFTISTPNVYDVESLELESVDGQKSTFRAVLQNACSQHSEELIMTLESAGTRALETEKVPLFAVTLRKQGSDSGETL